MWVLCVLCCPTWSVLCESLVLSPLCLWKKRRKMQCLMQSSKISSPAALVKVGALGRAWTGFLALAGGARGARKSDPEFCYHNHFRKLTK